MWYDLQMTFLVTATLLIGTHAQGLATTYLWSQCRIAIHYCKVLIHTQSQILIRICEQMARLFWRLIN